MKSIIKKSSAFKKKFAAVVLTAIMIISVFGAAAEQGTIVTVQHDAAVYSYATAAETVGEFLEEEGITLKENDQINFEFTAPVEAGMHIEIKTAKFITVHEGETTYGMITYESTVEGTLTDFNAPLREYDGCYPERDEFVYDGSHIWVARANQVTFTRSGSSLSYHSHAETVGRFLEEIGVVVGDDEMVVPEMSTPMYNGISIRISDKIDAMSTLDFGFDLSDATKVITCKATAYTSAADECGPWADGYTATGAKCEVGVVAVDPRVIPLGTKLYIEAVDGSFVYGFCSAEDTGGAIKGNKVDLAMNTKSECFQFGRRDVRVYVFS